MVINMKLNQITKNELPRERIINNGASSLTDTELLAIILSFGTKNENVLELSRRLISTYGLSQLLYMSYEEISKISGIKQAKATKLLACFELAKRSIRVTDNQISFTSSKEIYHYIKNDYVLEGKEVLTILYVTSKVKLIKKAKYTNSSSFSCEFPIRKIVSDALALDSYGLVMIHNHPSGDVKPSRADIEATQTIKMILRELNILLLDHIIISNDKYYSFDENHILNGIKLT